MEYVYVIDDGLSLYFKHKQHVSIFYILFISKINRDVSWVSQWLANLMIFVW